MLKTVTKQELQADLNGVIAQMEEGQELLVLDGTTPLARISSINYGGSTEVSAPLRIHFSAFELPFP